MPRYYRFGFQPYDYESGWKGWPVPSTSPAAETRQLGDVTDFSSQFMVPKSGSPYYQHKAEQSLPFFEVPRSGSPYFIHKQQQHLIEPVGIVNLSRSEKQALTILGVAGAAAFLIFSKRSPLRALGRR